jgi:hypothetical protein
LQTEIGNAPSLNGGLPFSSDQSKKPSVITRGSNMVSQNNEITISQSGEYFSQANNNIKSSGSVK